MMSANAAGVVVEVANVASRASAGMAGFWLNRWITFGSTAVGASLISGGIAASMETIQQRAGIQFDFRDDMNEAAIARSFVVGATIPIAGRLVGGAYGVAKKHVTEAVGERNLFLDGFARIDRGLDAVAAAGLDF